MKTKTVCLIIVCIMVIFLGGCKIKSGRDLHERPPAGIKASAGNAAMPENTGGEIADPNIVKEPKDSEEAAECRASDRVYEESEVDASAEDGESRTADTGAPPADTVEYVESGREKRTEKRCIETAVDENDPSTYTVVRTERKTEVVEDIPVEYSDAAGNVRYALLDGIWHDYRYSTGDITMPGERNDEEALSLLNMFGDYDGYEVVKVECSVKEGEEEKQYVYRVLYRKARALSGLPENLENFTVSKTRQETVIKTETVEEKVPVKREQTVDTGEYIYYGWQELNGKTYYFDKHGEKVTGMQIIQGIGFLFDEDGVLLQRSGVNVSRSGKVTDWRKVKDSGIDFALIRCGYRGAEGGMLIKDSGFEENLAAVQNVGMEPYVYFYSQAVTQEEAAEEAGFLVSMAKDYGITTPLMIVSGYTKDFKGRADGLSLEDRTACVEAFCKAVKNAGYMPMLGADEDWMKNCLDMKGELRDLRICLTQYGSGCAGGCDIWSYTGNGAVDGINGPAALCIKCK